MDEKKLLKYSIDYLGKYNSSKKNLSDVLKRKIFRLKVSNLDKKDLINKINNIISKLEKNNILNDNRYCLSKISSLSRYGRSENFIFNYLIKKGVNKIEIQNSLQSFSQDNDNWELISAKHYAKKKKLLESDGSFEKKLAKMARAGFKYDICKKVLG